jgi:hypothetical protein
MKSHLEKLTFEKVWKLFQETDKKFHTFIATNITIKFL